MHNRHLERPAAPAGSRAAQPVPSKAMKAAEEGTFLESLMDTNLYSMGAYFSDQHPDLVDEVIEQGVSIEQQGIRRYAESNQLSMEECFETLLTGLAVRYYKAVAS